MFCATFRHFTRFWCWFLPGKNCIGALICVNFLHVWCIMHDLPKVWFPLFDYWLPHCRNISRKNTVSTYPLRSWRPCHVPFQPASSLGKGHGGGKLTANLCSSLVQPSLLDKWQMREDWTAIFLGWILPWFLESNIRAASCQFIS